MQPETPNYKTDFLRLPRQIQSNYQNGLLRFEEFVLLVWLWLDANPHNGKVKVSYDGLAKDFSLRYTKNFINKIMLALKSKKCVWFKNQQGRRGSFEVHINNYPLADGTFSNLETRFGQTIGKSGNSSADGIVAEPTAEVRLVGQKLPEGENAMNKPDSWQSGNPASRSTNNDNKKDNVIRSASYKGNDNDEGNLLEFIPKNLDEEKCLKIAAEFGEKDINFILSRLKKYGIAVIESAYNETKNGMAVGRVIKPAAYFNHLVGQLGRKTTEYG